MHIEDDACISALKNVTRNSQAEEIVCLLLAEWEVLMWERKKKVDCRWHYEEGESPVLGHGTFFPKINPTFLLFASAQIFHEKLQLDISIARNH